MTAAATENNRTPIERLREFHDLLCEFNPDVCNARRSEILDAALRTPPEHFPEFANFADSLLTEFAQTPWKVQAREIMAKLAARIKAAQNRLPGLKAPPGDASSTERHSVALATQATFSSLDWIRILDEAQPPPALQHSIDALVNRNNLTETVFRTLFDILYEIDAEQANEWMESYLAKHRGELDPDIVRDLLRCWAERDDLPENTMEWTLEWAADEELRHQWPVISRLADRILRRRALARHAESTTDRRRTLLRRLDRQVRSGATTDSDLQAWTDEAIERIGFHIQAFSRFIGQTDRDAKGGWVSKALREELDAVNDLLPPVLLLADVALAETNGATRLAMALIGLPTPELDQWRETLQRETEHFVTRTFLDDLRAGRKPESSIRAFCLGDTELLRQMISDLDILTRDFETREQRDRIARQLAVHYASFREQHKLPREITRRYRQLMQTLHPDNLNRLLSPEDAGQVATMSNLRELSSTAADARRYLSRHQAWDDSLQELLAARLDFEKSIRRRRLRLIHALLLQG